MTQALQTCLGELQEKITSLQQSTGPEYQQMLMKTDCGFACWNVLNAYGRKLSAEVTEAREAVNKAMDLAEGQT